MGQRINPLHVEHFLQKDEDGELACICCRHACSWMWEGRGVWQTPLSHMLLNTNTMHTVH